MAARSTRDQATAETQEAKEAAEAPEERAALAGVADEEEQEQAGPGAAEVAAEAGPPMLEPLGSEDALAPFMAYSAVDFAKMLQSPCALSSHSSLDEMEAYQERLGAVVEHAETTDGHRADAP